jgi:uncharacterized protein YbbK (DUF523 family)
MCVASVGRLLYGQANHVPLMFALMPTHLSAGVCGEALAFAFALGAGGSLDSADGTVVAILILNSPGCGKHVVMA